MSGLNLFVKDIGVEPSRPKDSFVQQAQTGIRKRLSEWRSEQLPAFGRPIGFVINYAPDCAVRYDLGGNSVDVLDEAHPLGMATRSVKRGPMGGLLGSR